LVLVLTALMFGSWWLSSMLLPREFLRPHLTRLFSARVGEFTFGRVLLANLLPLQGAQFMNLFRAGRYSGGLYVVPALWVLYGVLLGTNSFVYAGDPVPLSISVLWTRTGFGELLAYTTAYEATKNWTIWEQQGVWRARRLKEKRWKPEAADWAFWTASLALLFAAVGREVG